MPKSRSIGHNNNLISSHTSMNNDDDDENYFDNDNENWMLVTGYKMKTFEIHQPV